MANIFSICLIAALAVVVVVEAKPLPCHEGCEITVDGFAAGEGEGSASDAHAADIYAEGIPASTEDDGVPASVSVYNGGGSEVLNNVGDLQYTNIDPGVDMYAVQLVGATQFAYSGDGLGVVASGGEVGHAASSAANAQGAGAIVSAGEVYLAGQA